MHGYEINQLIRQVLSKERVNRLMIQMIDYDIETYVHSLRVAYNTILMAPYIYQTKQLVVDKNMEALVEGALLHDIGKLSVPKEVLHKQTKLSKKDIAYIHQHPLNGIGYLTDPGHPKIVNHIILKHHEKLDGSGYPCGYKVLELEDEVKAVAIADMFSAMTERRCYKEPFSKGKALSLLADDVPDKIDAHLFKVLRLAVGEMKEESEFLDKLFCIRASNGQYFCGWNEQGIRMTEKKKDALAMKWIQADKELPKVIRFTGMHCYVE